MATQKPVLYINGEPLPFPKRGVSTVVTTVVDSGRNLNAAVVGQRIGRDQYKIDGVEFPMLTAEEWKRVLQLVSGFRFNLKFLDPVTNDWKTIKAYCGDRTAEPYWTDKNGKYTHYINCKVNFIDTGD